jgi:hypothetical protein
MGSTSGWRRGAGAEVHPDVVVVQEVDDPVEVGEVVLAGPGFDGRPAEDVDGHEADAGGAHEGHVLAPDVRRPLLEVVVAAEDEASRWGCVHVITFPESNGPMTNV